MPMRSLARPFLDELAEDVLGGGDAVGAASAEFEILGGHAHGEVHGDHDVDAAGA
jgi:hypothetical protein